MIFHGDNGYIVGFSFIKGAYEEVARARWNKKLEIRLLAVKDLIAPRPDRRPLFPEPASVTDLPLQPPRPPNESSLTGWPPASVKVRTVGISASIGSA